MGRVAPAPGWPCSHLPNAQQQPRPLRCWQGCYPTRPNSGCGVVGPPRPTVTASTQHVRQWPWRCWVAASNSYRGPPNRYCGVAVGWTTELDHATVAGPGAPGADRSNMPPGAIQSGVLAATVGDAGVELSDHLGARGVELRAPPPVDAPTPPSVTSRFADRDGGEQPVGDPGRGDQGTPCAPGDTGRDRDDAARDGGDDQANQAVDHLGEAADVPAARLARRSWRPTAPNNPADLHCWATAGR